jgi:BirA family transcriptional regulator, biotin operon repressor / biotin---[acetyl-CoA-carboxylase] ligase
VILDERVRSDLAESTRFSDIRLVDSTDSTNRLVRELAASGAPEGLVVAADVQTAGRGRLDRVWEAEPGTGLLVSLLLRPAVDPSEWHLVTSACALAAQDTCEEVAEVAVELKWPNDLMAGDRKLAGILAEATSDAVVVGMGLNVHSGPPGSAWIDDLAGRRVSRSDILAAWLARLDDVLDAWADIASMYRERCATVGRSVAVELLDGSQVTGVAESIDDAGRLVVATGSGRSIVAVGDVTHLRADRSD